MSNQKQKKSKLIILEEIANSITHGFGLILSILGIFIFISYPTENNPWAMLGLIIYCSSLIILYLSSTIYHALPQSRLKAIFRRLDHSSIYLLIAGTYTPIILISMRTTWVLYILPMIWIMAIIGIYIKLFYIHKYEHLSLIFYLFMGWFALIAIRPLFNSVPIESFILIIIGGLSYTSGIIFYKWDRLQFSHAIWHIFVLFGSIFHYIGILYL